MKPGSFRLLQLLIRWLYACFQPSDFDAANNDEVLGPLGTGSSWDHTDELRRLFCPSGRIPAPDMGLSGGIGLASEGSKGEVIGAIPKIGK